MGKRILIVDDEPHIVNVLTRILANRGFEAFGAKGGKDAIEILNSADKKVDLVITDLKMPDVPGYKVVKECIEKQIPIIVFTASIEVTTYEKELNAVGYNVADILHKPLDMNLLLCTINSKLSINIQN
jgi:two-component system, OmpR family, response regulator